MAEKYQTVTVKVNGHAGFLYKDPTKPKPDGKSYESQVLKGVVTILKTPEVEKALRTTFIHGRGWKIGADKKPFFDQGRQVTLLEEIPVEPEVKKEKPQSILPPQGRGDK